MKIFYKKEIILGQDYFLLQNMAIMGEQAVCSSTIQYLKPLLLIKVNLVNSMHISYTIINLMIFGEGKRNNNVSEDFFLDGVYKKPPWFNELTLE